MRIKTRAIFQTQEARLQSNDEKFCLIVSLFIIKLPFNIIQLDPDLAIKLNLNVLKSIKP